MLRKLIPLILIIILIYPLSSEAALSDDISSFKQKYADIYQNINPAIAAQMDVFIPDVLDYLMDNYDTEQNIDVQIKNAIGSTLLTGETYKNDLLPFLLEQAKNKEQYQAQLNEMQGIVRNEAQSRLNSMTPGPPGGGGGGGNNMGNNQPDLEKDLEKKTPAQPQTPAAVSQPEQPAPSVPAPLVSFQDTTQHWARAAIEKMASQGLVSGVGPGVFEPDRSITRAEFTAILLRTLGIKPESQVTGRFTDVFADQWYFDTINTAANRGLINGYSDSLFAPQEAVTREQMAVMIDTAWRFQGKDLAQADNYEASLMLFTDSHFISPWASAAVAAAVQQGIIQGRGNNIFAPQENATRAEASVLLLKLYQEKE